MRSFVLRARAAPTTSKALLEGVGNEAHTAVSYTHLTLPTILLV